MVGPADEFDAVLELCRSPHRRIVLAVLAHEMRSLTVRDLAGTIATHNHHQPLAEVPEAESSRIRLSLVHSHVPKLADYGLVEYDQERQLVEPTPRFERLESQISAVIGADPKLDAPVSL